MRLISEPSVSRAEVRVANRRRSVDRSSSNTPPADASVALTLDVSVNYCAPVPSLPDVPVDVSANCICVFIRATGG